MEFKFHLALDISNYMHELVSVANPYSQETQASRRQNNPRWYHLSAVLFVPCFYGFSSCIYGMHLAYVVIM